MATRLHITPDNPAPEGAEAGRLLSADGRNIRFATFPATSQPKRGTLVLLSGRNETIEKYFETVRDLTGRGFFVVAMDWRGQGGSDRLLADPARGYVKSFDDYAADLDLLFREVVIPRGPKPVFLLAHSTGALVALLAAEMLEGTVRRMVFASPFLGLSGFPLSFRAIGRLSRGMSLLGMGSRYLGGGPKPRVNTTFDGNVLTNDPTRFRRNQSILETFPLLGLGGPTAAWVNAACTAIDRVSDPIFASRIRVPTLFVAAGNDRVVSTPAIEAFASKLPGGSLLVIDGARHELMQETDRLRDQFWAAFDAFIPGGAEQTLTPALEPAR